MANDCCSSDGDCAPPPLKFPEPAAAKPASAPATAAECGGTACGCHGGALVFDGMDPRYKRVLWTVIALNGVMFLTEMAAGQLAGSQALKADALDFLADTGATFMSPPCTCRACEPDRDLRVETSESSQIN
jgi:hypothetical protein